MKIIEQQNIDVRDFVTREIGEQISTHLGELLEMNQPVALERLVTPEKQKSIVDAIQQHGDLSLKTLKEFLDDSYSYDELKLVRGWWRAQQQ